MKKLLLVLGMMMTIFSLTACGTKTEETDAGEPMMTGEEAVMVAENTVQNINDIVLNGAEEQFVDAPVIMGAISSWKSAMDEMGAFVGVTGVQSEIGDKTAVLTIEVEGEIRNATIVMDCDLKEGITGFTLTPHYTFGELMTKAALNTLVGMGTVFSVLILISFLISGFKIIPKIQAKFEKKPEAVEVKEEVVNQTAAPVMEEEELTDDLELAAVIAAAIAASEGHETTEGFRVRSIKRARTNKWQRA